MISRVDHGTERPARPAVDGRRRVVVAEVRPLVDGGRFPVKRVLGDVLDVEADLLVDGHDTLAGCVLYRHEGAGPWSEQPLEPLGNDRWHAGLTLSQLGRWQYTVESWVDEWASFVWGLRRKVDAGQEVSVELLGAAALLRAAVERAGRGGRGDGEDDARRLADAAARVGDATVDARERATLALDATLSACMARHPDRRFATRFGRVLEVVVDPVRARFSAWYELFPRSTGAPGQHGTFADAERRLQYVADLGFDVVYLPPIHPIGL